MLAQAFHDMMDDALNRIKQHPFLLELQAGTLAKDIFKAYLKQDTIFLKTSYQVSKSIAQLAPDPNSAKQLNEMAEMVLQEEQAMCRICFDAKEIWLDQTAAGFAYCQFLLSNANHYALGLAATLPCDWVYHVIAVEMSPSSLDDHPYREWYEHHQGDKSDQQVTMFIELVHAAYEQADATLREQMLERFKQATLLEWAFWNDVYHGRYLFS